MKTVFLALTSLLLIFKTDNNINSDSFNHRKGVEIIRGKVPPPTSYNLSFYLEVPSHTLTVSWNANDIGEVSVPIRWEEFFNETRYVTIKPDRQNTVYIPAIIQPNVIQHFWIAHQLAKFKWDGVNPECIIICQPGPVGGCPFQGF